MATKPDSSYCYIDPAQDSCLLCWYIKIWKKHCPHTHNENYCFLTFVMHWIWSEVAEQSTDQKFQIGMVPAGREEIWEVVPFG